MVDHIPIPHRFAMICGAYNPVNPFLANEHITGLFVELA